MKVIYPKGEKLALDLSRILSTDNEIIVKSNQNPVFFEYEGQGYYVYLKYGIVEPSEAKITVKPRLSPRFIAKSHGNRYLCGSKQVSRSTTGILFQFKVWTLLACGVKIGRSMPYDRIHISKSRRLAY